MPKKTWLELLCNDFLLESFLLTGEDLKKQP